MQKHFKQPIKCIVLLRDLMDVLASYIKWFETEPSSFINKQGTNIEEKLSGYDVVDYDGTVELIQRPHDIFMKNGDEIIKD